MQLRSLIVENVPIWKYLAVKKASTRDVVLEDDLNLQDNIGHGHWPLAMVISGLDLEV